MEDNKLYAWMWGVVCVFLCVIVISVTTYNINRNANIAELVNKGNDPIEVGCAFDNMLNETCRMKISLKSR